MIENFKEREIRDSAVIYRSTFEQIKQLYQVNKEQAGELAISAIELMLTGDISSNDFYINLMLTDAKVISEKNKNKYSKKVEIQKQKKVEELQLVEIAELKAKGLTQKAIGEKLGLSQQTVSYRLGIIKDEYQELYKNTKNTKNTNTDNEDEDEDEDDNEDVVSSALTSVRLESGQSPDTPATSQEEFNRMWGIVK